MATAQLEAARRVFDEVRTRAHDDHGDGELLERFRTGRDAAAFTCLVRRHAGMVLGVCRRVLRDPHAAEDAFQATFLVLARKADAVRPPGLLGPWLYGVAYRTALKARGREFRRRQVEREYATDRRHDSPEAHAPDVDLRPVLDQQLSALPEKYRLPLVLCAVQGLGKAEAAERLGLPEGTVSSRLARAREMLRDRLTRRGFVVPAAGLAAVLVPGPLRAAVPTNLSAGAAGAALGTVPAAPAVLTLTREVLSAMTLMKSKLLAAVAVAVALTGGGFGLYAATADEKKPGDKPAVEKPKPEKPGGEKPAKPAPDDPEKPRTEKPAAPEGARKPVKVAGPIVAVDAAGRTVTMARKRDNGTFEEFLPVAADAKVFVDNKPAELKDVPKGAVASVVFGPGKDGVPPVVAELRVTGEAVTGILVEVSPDHVGLSGGKESKAPPRKIRLAPGGKVHVGKATDAKLTDLKPGDKVTAVMTTDGTAALTISGGGREREGDPKGAKPEKPAKPDGDED